VDEAAKRIRAKKEEAKLREKQRIAAEADKKKADDDAADGEGATVRCVRRDHRNLKLGIHSMDFCPSFM
jgi:hypothetical protein